MFDLSVLFAKLPPIKDPVAVYIMTIIIRFASIGLHLGFFSRSQKTDEALNKIQRQAHNEALRVGSDLSLSALAIYLGIGLLRTEDKVFYLAVFVAFFMGNYFLFLILNGKDLAEVIKSRFLPLYLLTMFIGWLMLNAAVKISIAAVK